MSNQYSFSEFVKTVYSWVCTKLTFPSARLIRRPIYLRGRKSMYGCKGLTTGRFCRFDLIGTKKTLKIGDNCELGDMTHIVAYNDVSIGNNVLAASKCFISDTNHGEYHNGNQSDPGIPPRERQLTVGEVFIGNNVWLGENVVILAGTKVGNGCIIGANSVVKGEIPDNCICAGAPAKILKRFDTEERKWKRI